MKASPRRVPLALVALSCLLSSVPALAEDVLRLTLAAREAGDEVRTVVTGQGEQRSVAWPDGPAAMTPLWLVGQTRIEWMCSDGRAARLEVKTDKGPHTRPLSVDMRRQTPFSGSADVDLYLWEVASVKAACTKNGEARVESIPVHLTLQCPKGRRFQQTQTLSLLARCRPSEPSQEAVTGVTGSEADRKQAGGESSLGKFTHHRPAPAPDTVYVGQRQTVSLGEVSRQAPALRSLRVLRLDDAGKVLERLPPAPPEEGGGPGTFAPRVTLAPKAVGTLHFALEAEYPDGSRVVSKPAAVTAEPPRKPMRRTRPLTPEQRAGVMDAAGKKLAELGCGPELVKWLKQQPHVADAGGDSHNLWLNFSDGQPLLLSCH